MVMDANPDPIETTTSELPENLAGLSFAAQTDIGLVRYANEDTYGWYPTTHGPLLLVLDGMGGHSRGKLAARTALGEIRRYINAQYNHTPEILLREALRHANRVIATMNHNKIEFSRMGTTVVAALWSGHEMTYAHVGDSRLYLLRNNHLKLLTTDDTYVQQLLDGGIITLHDARNHPDRHRLTQAIGVMYDVTIHTCNKPLQCLPDDLIVACTDGLTEVLTDIEIQQTILHHLPNLQDACDQLVEAAKLGGGPDNITVVLTRINPRQ